jgi:hypothetical protein
MGRIRRVPDPQRFDPKKQSREMTELFPAFGRRAGRGDTTWIGPMQPTPDSTRYTVRVTYSPRQAPAVWIDSPAIKSGAPHRYSDGSLCLFWPKEWRWSPEDSLAQTILPWTALWLYYYEMWQTTGEWLGPSSPHGSDSIKAREDAGN